MVGPFYNITVIGFRDCSANGHLVLGSKFERLGISGDHGDTSAIFERRSVDYHLPRDSLSSGNSHKNGSYRP